jgi:hypothetical protein
MTYTTAFDLYVPDKAADERRRKKNAREGAIYQTITWAFVTVAIVVLAVTISTKPGSTHEPVKAPGDSVSTTGWW